MNASTQQTGKRRASPGSIIGWGVAVLVVIGAWVVVLDLRSGQNTDKQVMVGWQDGLDAGKQVAAEQDRPMVVLFTASWCPPCQRLKKSVFQDAAVNQLLGEQYVAVQVDLSDRSHDNPNHAIRQQYHVNGIPAVMAMNKQGDVVSVMDLRQPQNFTPDGFMLWLNDVGVQAEMNASAKAGSR
ncbi:MAG: thioredoxin family protein [Planctomycetota bacterium]